MLKAGLLLVSGNASQALLTLIRGLIVARLISVENFGIASTLMISVALVEMLSALGMQQQIIQAKNGDDPRLQAALQAFQVTRGAMNSAILFLLSPWIAQVMGVPEVTWAYRVMAIAPFLNGLVHFDMHRMNRQMRYLPTVLTLTLPALVSLVLVWPLHHLFGDYRVMLYAVLAQFLITILVSHLVAKRPYRLIWDRAIIAGSLRFGWPIMVNGLLLFLVFNGEKLIVGREIGMASLAVFSMGLTLTQTPGLVLERSAQSFFLPQLAAAQQDGPRFATLAMVAMQAHLLFGAALVVGVLLLGEPAVWLLLGAKYAALVPLMTWLAILQGIRLFKGGSSCVSLARAQTENSMVANLMRVLSLPLAFWVAADSGDLVLVIWISIAGEIAGFVASLFLARWRLRLGLRPLLAPMAAISALLVLAAVQAQSLPGGLPGFLDTPASVPASALAAPAADPAPPPAAGSAEGSGMMAQIAFGFGALALLGGVIATMGDLRRYVMQRRFPSHPEGRERAAAVSPPPDFPD